MLRGIRTYSVQMRQRGQVTLPQELRHSLAIEAGDTLTVVQIGDALVLSPRSLRTPGLIDHMADLLDEGGITLADLLADLPRIRQELYRDRYQTGSVK